MGKHSDYDKVVSDINKGDIKNLYLFFGFETFLIKDALVRLESSAINPAFKSLNYLKLDGMAASYDAIVNACETLPFMDEKRMVVVTDCPFFKPKKSKGEGTFDDGKYQELCSWLSMVPDTTVLVLMAGDEVDERTKIFKAVKSQGEVVEFGQLKGQQIVKWIEKGFKSYNKSISRQEAVYLAGRVPVGLNDMLNEIDKICSYTGQKRTISREDIDAVVSKSLETNVFQLVDSISLKNPGRALLILNDMLQGAEPAARIFAMIIRQYRLLLNVKLLAEKGYDSTEISRKLKLNPFVVSNMLRISKSYSEDQIEKRFKRCLDIDLAIKTGKAGERVAIEALIVEFAV